MHVFVNSFTTHVLLPILEKASFCRFLPNLNTLILSKNKLSKFNSESLMNLTKISLGHNFFTELPDLALIQNLQELRINNNQISEVSQALLQNRKLKVLDISNNKFSSWDSIRLLTNLGQLTNLCVKGNPLPPPGVEAKSLILREDFSSDSIQDEQELLYRRFILSMFQKNVGEKGLPKIQIIVLDMKRVKMKFSHNHDNPGRLNKKAIFSLNFLLVSSSFFIL